MLPERTVDLSSMIYRLLIIVLAVGLFSSSVYANPTQYGSSGLLHVSTADTLDAANFCVGVWGNCSDKADTGLTSIMPVSLTLGIGTFWEVYGTYPNVYNGRETPYSGRGTADVGMKLRFWGQRSSRLKIAVDGQLRRYVDDDPLYNGINDKGAKVIASYRGDTFSTHISGGYMSNGQSRDLLKPNPTKAATEYPVAAGVDFLTSTRTKTTFEILAASVTDTTKTPVEAFAGFQYYLTPHLTLNLSLGAGLNSAAPDWRAVFGLSTCQGVGNYIKPVPEVKSAKKDPVIVKPTRVIALSPLLIKTPEVKVSASKFEVPVDVDGEEILIRPYGNVVIPTLPALAKAPAAKIPAALPDVAREPLVLTPPLPLTKDPASEIALSKVSGVTPLYGVRIKGEVAAEEEIQSSMKAYRKFRLPDAIFEFDNAELFTEVQKSVSELAQQIRKDDRWVFLRIDGHTDGLGSEKYNLDLSLRRAVAVANYLISREGIDPAKIFVRGMGKGFPIADNNTDEGRKQNRRFEIFFLIHKDEKLK